MLDAVVIECCACHVVEDVGCNLGKGLAYGNDVDVVFSLKESVGELCYVGEEEVVKGVGPVDARVGKLCVDDGFCYGALVACAEIDLCDESGVEGLCVVSVLLKEVVGC